MSETCASPICEADVPDGKRAGARYCSDHCRLEAWILGKAAKLLLPLPLSVWADILAAAQNVRLENHASSPTGANANLG